MGLCACFAPLVIIKLQRTFTGKMAYEPVLYAAFLLVKLLIFKYLNKMKAIVKIEKEVEIKTIEVAAEARYWEDAEINGQSTEEGELVPFKKGDLWCPIIDIDTGIIKDWPQGTTAKIHFKVCDCGSYFLKDEQGNTVLSIENDYVPKIMCPKENGYGDYIIMDIDENGKIQNWKADISSFQPED